VFLEHVAAAAAAAAAAADILPGMELISTVDKSTGKPALVA
jgi:hypothetical protein